MHQRLDYSPKDSETIQPTGRNVHRTNEHVIWRLTALSNLNPSDLEPISDQIIPTTNGDLIRDKEPSGAPSPLRPVTPNPVEICDRNLLPQTQPGLLNCDYIILKSALVQKNLARLI